MRYLIAFTVALLSFTGTALAATGVSEVAPDGLLELARPVIDAALHGNPLLAAAMSLVLGVALARRYAPERWGLRSDIGGTALTFLGALGTAGGAALMGGSLPSWGLLWTAVTVAAAASGGYTAIKRLAVPAIRWAEGHVPGFMRPVVGPLLNLLLWTFESNGKAIARAEVAGKSALEVKPSAGVAAITDIEDLR